MASTSLLGRWSVVVRFRHVRSIHGEERYPSEEAKKSLTLENLVPRLSRVDFEQRIKALHGR